MLLAVRDILLIAVLIWEAQKKNIYILSKTASNEYEIHVNIGSTNVERMK